MDQDPVEIPDIKTEPNVSVVPVVRECTIITGYIQNCLPLYLCVLVKQKFDCRDWILASLYEKNICASQHVKYHLQWSVLSTSKSNTSLIVMGVTVTPHIVGIMSSE
jgi:hypothetical protein